MNDWIGNRKAPEACVLCQTIDASIYFCASSMPGLLEAQQLAAAGAQPSTMELTNAANSACSFFAVKMHKMEESDRAAISAG